LQGLRLFKALAEQFWPGPLTIVARAVPQLPSVVTAGTGFVGVRIPANATALELLHAAGVPVAAPSANRFGHVSPTRARHVLDDLGGCDITVLLGEGQLGTEHIIRPGDSCSIGIESTVVKIEEAEDGSPLRLVVFRLGGVPVRRIRSVLLADAELRDTLCVVRIVHRPLPNTGTSGDAASAKPPACAADLVAASTADGLDAPGMLLTHYAPDLRCFLLTSFPPHAAPDACSAVLHTASESATAAAALVPLEELVVLDCSGSCAQMEKVVLAYRDIAPCGDFGAARACIFDALRWAESVPGARAVIIADPFLALEVDRDDAEALRDRMFRACSGACVTLAWAAPVLETSPNVPISSRGSLPP
jgi:L-threonylcarbamoyladenylate synthase